MKKGIAVLCSLLLVLGALPLTAAAAGTVETAAKSVLLMERETGTILYEENAHERLAPASVTKIMTMLLTAEAIESGALSMDEQVSASANAAGMGGSQVYLEEGEQMSVSELLKAVAVASGNDAAVALAERLGGSESGFVERMNARAQELGMEDTHFVNCTGLPAEGHLTTAYDIALMSRALLDHECIRPFVGTWMDTLRGGDFQLSNTNKLIHSYQGATGLKTGFTQDAGFCISASAERDGMELIAVVLGSESSADRFRSARALLDYGFACWSMVELSAQEPIPAVPVTLGEQDSVRPEPECVTKLLLPREQAAQVRFETSTLDSVTAPVAKGQTLGSVTAYVGDEQAGSVKLVAGEEVARKTMGRLFSEMLSALSNRAAK